MDEEIGHDTSSWGSALPGPDNDDDGVSWASFYSYHVSRYPQKDKFMDEDCVTVVGSLCRTPYAKYIPCISEWLEQDLDRIFMG